MRIVTLASGSTGNCSLLINGKANILIDAGISMRRTVQSLAEFGLTPRDLCGVLITHEHSDHISGLSMLVKYHNIKIFAPKLLCEILRLLKPEISKNLYYIPTNEYFEFNGLRIKAFSTPHDAGCSVGYRFEGESVFAFATDTGHISEELIEGLSGADTVVIEANHDVEMLKCGPYPYYLKRRILSDKGHLSNSECGKLAFSLAKTGTKSIILGHISRENNTPQTALNTVGELLCGLDVKLYTAPMRQCLEVCIGEKDECSV